MLAVITGRADLLLRRACDGVDGSIQDGRDDLEAIALAAADAAAMLRRLNDPAKPLPPENCNLEREVRRVALLVTPPGGERWDRSGKGEGRPLELAVNRDLYAALPGQVVREVLTNLFVNALEAMPETGGISVTSAERDGRVLLLVADEGPGLAPGLAADLFSPGVSGHGRSGRGLGLAGCRDLLVRQGGSLEFRDDRGPGAVFEIDLPLGKSEPGKAEPAGTGRPVEAAADEIRVLVVDDEPEVRAVLTDLLGAMGCRVSVARDASSGREIHAAETFDLVLLDLTLPDGGGLELAGELRAADPVSAIVAITGVDRESALDGADPATVDLKATKPLGYDELLELVNRGARLARERRRTKEA